MQYAWAILSSVACLILQNFSTLSHKRYYFLLKKKGIVNNMCFLISSTTFIRNISRSKKNWARYDKSFLFVFIYITHYSRQTLMKLTFFLTVYPKIWNIRFNENPCNGNRSVQSQLTDWQTDFTELLFAFRNYADAPKNVIFYSKE